MTTTTTNNVSKFTSKEQVLAALASGQCTVDAASAWLAAHSSNGHSKGFYVKANPVKGTVSLYGLNRMPFTLYPEQWRTLLKGAAGDTVTAFLDKFADYLPQEKGQDAAKPVPASLIGEGKPFRHPKERE